MRVGLITREYPPDVYGGAGVHVEYLGRELARRIEVEVHCWGAQRLDAGNLHVRGQMPPPEVSAGCDAKFTAAVDALALNLSQMKELGKIDIVHTHTWYAAMAGFLAKKLYGIPVCDDNPLAGAAAARGRRSSSAAAIATELLDGAHGDPRGRGRGDRRVEWDAGRHPTRPTPTVDASTGCIVIYNGIDAGRVPQDRGDRRARQRTVSIPAVPYVRLRRPDHAPEGRCPTCSRTR